MPAGWLIELGVSEPSAPLYWCGQGWHADRRHAVRFVRRLDAELTAKAVLGALAIRLTAYVWDDDINGTDSIDRAS